MIDPVPRAVAVGYAVELMPILHTECANTRRKKNRVPQEGLIHVESTTLIEMAVLRSPTLTVRFRSRIFKHESGKIERRKWQPAPCEDNDAVFSV